VEEQKKILIVDDEEVFLEQLKDALENSSLDLRIDTASVGVEALEKMEAERHDIVITDVKMPRMDGYTLLREIQNRFPSTYVVVITAFGSISGAVEAIKYGAYDFLEKPFNIDSLEIRSVLTCEAHMIFWKSPSTWIRWRSRSPRSSGSTRSSRRISSSRARSSSTPRGWTSWWDPIPGCRGSMSRF
jgi:DNA-binding response OmpR family regulator